MKKQETRPKRSGTDFSELKKHHPHKTILFFALLASTVLFLSLTFLFLVTYFRSELPAGFKVPNYFFLGTIFLLVSSYGLTGIKQAFGRDDYPALKKSLLFSILTGTCFLICQAAGWYQLLITGNDLQSHSLISFFYIISALHLIHAFAGIVILLALLIRAGMHQADPVRSLLYFSDNLQLLRLELGVIFWHFVDVLWVGLFILFLFTLG